MKQLATTLLLLLPALLPAAAPPHDLLDSALDELGLERSRMTPDPARLLLSTGRPVKQLSICQRLLLNPLDAAYLAGQREDSLLRVADNPYRLTLAAVGSWDADMARGYGANPFARLEEKLFAGSEPLAEALRSLDAAAGTPMTPARLEELRSRITVLPPAWQREVARVALIAAGAPRWAGRAFPATLDRDNLLSQTLQLAEPADADYRWRVPQVDREALGALALDGAMALEGMLGFLASPAPQTTPPFHFEWETALGTIVVDTRDSDDTYDAERYLLIVDTHGDDTYGRDPRSMTVTGGGSSNPLTIVVDRAGNDTYRGPATSCGMGFLGASFLDDAAGDDAYIGDIGTGGTAIFGSSLVMDHAGNDRHEGLVFCQAAAIMGCSTVVDATGNDRWFAVSESQASAGPVGVATLLELGGNDTYLLASKPLLRASAQLPDRNSSVGQGCGWGRRADIDDGRSLPGGLATLIDAAGDDSMTADIFAQGAAFLQGAGILIDEAGNDTRKAAYYAQAASAHQGTGVLIDRAGKDVAVVEREQGIGSAHDYSSAFYIDLAGDDSYAILSHGLGSANENGVTLFADVSGSDRYASRSLSFGSASVDLWGSLREDQLGLGLFFDLAGSDAYTSMTLPANNKHWRGSQRFPDLGLRSELGRGEDRETTATVFRTRALTPAGRYEKDMIKNELSARARYRGLWPREPVPKPAP